MDSAVILLAAGQGKRMKSALPKVLHPLCGRPMVYFVSQAVLDLDPDRFIIIASPETADGIKSTIGNKAEVIMQEEPQGTGDAVRKAADTLADFNGDVFVVCGDTPLISSLTLKGLIDRHRNKKAVVSVLTAKVEKPTGYGRIIRGNGGIKKIIEERDASPTERLIREINTGTYCFQAPELFRTLEEIKPKNTQKEYYLTDVVEILNKQRLKVVAFQVKDETEILGVNSRIELADAEMILRARINREHMKRGVTLVHPALTYIDADVKIGKDTVIHPMSFLYGQTSIGKNCRIGPLTQITDSEVGTGSQVLNSVLNEVEVGNHVRVGPFASLRPGTSIENGSKIGSFVEIKKSKVGKGSRVPHLSYIGDTDIGKDVNIGAGTITCNFDGYKKHRTVIGDEAFIGSDTILVAPVKVGKRSFTGAGSTISKDVPDETLALERSEQKVIKSKKQKKKKKSK